MMIVAQPQAIVARRRQPCKVMANAVVLTATGAGSRTSAPNRQDDTPNATLLASMTAKTLLGVGRSRSTVHRLSAAQIMLAVKNMTTVERSRIPAHKNRGR